jgi:predicted RNase H-like HicB family nuclease
MGATMARYTVLLTPDHENGGFTVRVPELPGCVTEGDSYEEAMERAREAIELWIEAAVQVGDDVRIEATPPIVASIDIDVEELTRAMEAEAAGQLA